MKLYFDPAQADGLTLEREINFTNNWMGDDTKYSSPLVKKETIENL